MTFILRLPAMLVLFAVAALSFIGALAAGGVLSGVDTGVAQVNDVQAMATEAGAGQQTWLDVVLWAAAGVMFLIAAIRLIRRTQAFGAWLIGFALYAGRWMWSLQQDGSLMSTLQGLDINAYMQPAALLDDLAAPEAQVALLGVLLLVGLFALIIDAADRSHWDKQAG
ncbi:MAG: hypothetical protein AB7O98_10145 [Hyphomonadaceae bacterium]